VDLVEDGRHKFLVMSVPVFADGGVDSSRPAMGVVTLLIRPETRLFPLLTDDTVPTRTGETLLFRVDGAKPSYVSPLKGDSAGWSAVDRSLETLVPLAKRAAEGQDTFGEMLDYRAAPSFAATRWIVPPGWGLVVKVDREEALADFYQAGRLAGFAAGFLTLALAGLLFSLWRQGQRATLLREQIKQERAIFNLKGYAEKIVASVPSGLLVLAADLRVLSANRSFLESFFLRRDETLGRGLDDLVRGEGLSRRAREVMQSGTAQSDLPFDFFLPHRHETRPVRVTITSIRIEEQEDARLLLIIEDLSEEERLQAARKESEKRFQDLVQGLDAIVCASPLSVNGPRPCSASRLIGGSPSRTSSARASTPRTGPRSWPHAGPRSPGARTTSSSTGRSEPRAMSSGSGTSCTSCRAPSARRASSAGSPWT